MLGGICGRFFEGGLTGAFKCTPPRERIRSVMVVGLNLGPIFNSYHTFKHPIYYFFSYCMVHIIAEYCDMWTNHL